MLRISLVIVALVGACGYPSPARSDGGSHDVDAHGGGSGDATSTTDGQGSADTCHGSATYGYVGAPVTLTLPACVTSVTVDLSGAAGGSGTNFDVSSAGGMGARVQGSIAVATSSTLYIFVGGVGGEDGGAGGFNGGGSGGSDAGLDGGGGGGATDVRLGGTALTNRIFVAGGGGGGGICGTFGTSASLSTGGAGGSAAGGAAGSCASGDVPATGGTQSAGGALETNSADENCTGAFSGSGALALGGPGNESGGGGGGGGGYYGGGGGACGGGAGGSSLATATATDVVLTPNYQAGAGAALISW